MNELKDGEWMNLRMEIEWVIGWRMNELKDGEWMN